jgi:hypothetical protein
MLGTGNIITVPWNNIGAPILADIQSDRRRLQAAVPLSRSRTSGSTASMWMNIITNTQVRNLGGSSNTPFAEFDHVPETGIGGTGPGNKYMGVLRGQPTIRWHFCDDTLALNTDVDPSYATAPATATLAKESPTTWRSSHGAVAEVDAHVPRRRVRRREPRHERRAPPWAGTSGTSTSPSPRAID